MTLQPSVEVRSAGCTISPNEKRAFFLGTLLQQKSGENSLTNMRLHEGIRLKD